MERLTGREENGHAYIIGCPDFEIQKTVGMIIQRVVDKCADMEDILGDDYDLDQLRELVESMQAEVKNPHPDGDNSILACPCCGSGEYLENEDGNENRFCGQCGQRVRK